MDNVCFVIWMLGFPLINTIEALVMEKYLRREFSDRTKAMASLLNLVIWFNVAKLLYVS